MLTSDSQLKLTEIQQREIIRVILHCSGNVHSPPHSASCTQSPLIRLVQEKQYNLYYALVSQEPERGRPCGLRCHALVGDARMCNVVRAFGWWLAKDCCMLVIIKLVDFAVLKS